MDFNIFKQDTLKVTSQEGEIEGYASTYGTVDYAQDVILAGAYDDVIASKELPVMLFNHESYNLPIGKWEYISSDAKGLYVKGKLNLELDSAKQIYSSIKFGSISGISVRLNVDYDDIEFKEDCRVISKVKRVPEISIVSFPCNTEARITSVKAYSSQAITTEIELKKFMLEAGITDVTSDFILSKAKELYRTTTNTSNYIKTRLKKIQAQLSQ